MTGSLHQRDFHHPYQPYDIQLDFMNAVYDCIENKRVAILESPTGTGKSLSLICGTLTWLRDHKHRNLLSELQVEADDDDPAWMVEAERQQKQQSLLRDKAELNAKLARIRAAEDKARQRYESDEPSTKRQKIKDEPDPSADEDLFALDDYDSADESARSRHPQNAQTLSAATRALLQQLDPASYSEEDMNLEDSLKIYFCSRTHSQLSQFINELRRTDFSRDQGSLTGLNPSDSRDEDKVLDEAIKQLSLGSRKNLCINSQVARLGSNAAINERCLELQQSSTSSETKCKFIPNTANQVLVNDFRDHTLAKIRDIEDLGKLGKRIGICPYYASRAAIRPSELVTLPYPLLLQRSAREALGMSLKDHVVIIDEAHNLMDSITNIHTISITHDQLQKARSQLVGYLQKFKNRLKGKNRVYVAQVVRLLDSLLAALDQKAASSSREGQSTAAELLSGKGVDQINLFKLVEYLKESKLARKVEGYSEFEKAQAASHQKSGHSKAGFPVLTHVQEFLMILNHPDPEGRYFWNKLDHDPGESPNIQLKYMLLDPTQHFKEIVDDARAVILAGGTMSPMNEYTNHLFNYVDPARLQTLSCDHVIPPSNLVAIPMASGCHDGAFEFTFEKRKSEAVIKELGSTILKLATVIPDGLVVFFPSYAYMDTVRLVWQKVDAFGSIWDRLEKTKPIFQEPSSRGHSTDTESRRGSKVDELLANFSVTVHEPSNEKGALLFAVIGGSLSEGINFSDRLGRGVVVVGLPFPSSESPEWKAKVEFAQQRAGMSASARAAAAREMSTNTCMRAVNQSIGRAIRHKNDYAAIVLLDVRYGREEIRSRLPGWIKKSLQNSSADFASNMNALQRFFTSKS